MAIWSTRVPASTSHVLLRGMSGIAIARISPSSVLYSPLGTRYSVFGERLVESGLSCRVTYRLSQLEFG